MKMDYGFIVLEGIIGAGKSTLAKILAEQLNARNLMEEFEDNSFLPKFYEDPRRYAFPLEMSFLADRFNQWQREASQTNLFTGPLISDYIFHKCLIFSKNNLDPDEFDLYARLFDIIETQIPKPDLMLYLFVSPERALRQIAQRGRAYEKNIQKEYLEQLQQGYLNWIQTSKHQLPILILAAESLDFTTCPEHIEWVMTLLSKSWVPGMHILYPPGSSPAGAIPF